MKVFLFYFLSIGLFLTGCQEKEEEVDLDRMVKIEEEEAPEWSPPNDKQVAGEPSGSIQEMAFSEEKQMNVDPETAK